MSKHRKVVIKYEEPECCYPNMYGMGGGYGSSGGGYGAYWGIKWIYALLILIVVVLEFGRKPYPYQGYNADGCNETAADGSDETAIAAFGGFGYPGYGIGYPFTNQLIDNSVLFIIVVFLLILCTGCFWGGYGCGTGFGGYGY